MTPQLIVDEFGDFEDQSTATDAQQKETPVSGEHREEQNVLLEWTEDENDSDFDGESTENESNDDEPEMNYTSLDPWEVKEMRSVYSYDTEIKMKKQVEEDCKDMIPRNLPAFPDDLIARQVYSSVKLYGEQLYSNKSISETMHHVVPKLPGIKHLPLLFSADGFPITADLGGFLWLMSQGSSLNLCKNIDLYRIMMGGHIKESSKYVQQYAAMLNNCTKIWELHPERSQFTVQVGRKFSEGYPIVAIPGDNIDTFSSVTFTPQLWYTGDLKWYSELAGDLGAASNFPSSILKQCHSSMFSYADSIVSRPGWGNIDFPLPTWLKPLYEDIFFLHIAPADRELKMPVLRVKTEHEIDAEWEDMLQFYSNVIEEDPDQFDGVSTDDIFGSHLEECEALQILYARICEMGKTYAATKGHGFVYQKPPSWVLLRFLNCVLHADQNFAKHLLVLLIMLLVKMDVRCGISKPADDPNSKTTKFIAALEDKVSLKFIAHRIKEAIQEHGSALMVSHFPWRFKGQCVVDYLNCYFEVLAPVRETEESGADFLAVNLLIIIHRIAISEVVDTDKFQETQCRRHPARNSLWLGYYCLSWHVKALREL